MLKTKLDPPISLLAETYIQNKNVNGCMLLSCQVRVLEWIYIL